MRGFPSNIGIDLGTATVLIYEQNKGIVLKEPSVLAYDVHTGQVVSVGEDALAMIGRTPDRIRAVKPLSEGVITDHELCEKMLQFFMKKVLRGSFFKPNVALCVPAAITDVESRAVVEAAANAGARRVYLIEEPVAAAIGAGVDISSSKGHMVLDIGGGTADIAVLSLNGIVQKTSIKVGGDQFNAAVLKYVRDTYQVLIGEKMAEEIKIQIGSVASKVGDEKMEFKGRNLLTGLPVRGVVTRRELRLPLAEKAFQIVTSAQGVMERTPPELVADISGSGIIMTGGGSMLHGLPEFIGKLLKIRAYLAENPVDCVAIGTGLSFEYLSTLSDGFIRPLTNRHQ